MSLDNLLKIGQLKAHPRDEAEIAKLLGAARRYLEDAGSTTVSAETRFDAAYKALMQVGLAALMAKGFRPDAGKTGHHATILQSLTLTLGIDGKRVAVLDALRRKRNLLDYSGDDVDEGSVKACIEHAGRLLKEAQAQIGKRA